MRRCVVSTSFEPAAAISSLPFGVPCCGSRHRPSPSHRRFSNASEQQLLAPLVMLRQHANPALAMTCGFFRPSRLDRPSAALSPRPFRLAFPQEGGRTPHSRQQVIERTRPLGPSGHPASCGDGMNTDQCTRSKTEERPPQIPACWGSMTISFGG